MRADLPSGTVTFLFTDIEGSTRLLHSLGPDAYGEALADHRRLLREAFAAHEGIEIDTQGDAFFVAFPTATGAAGAARAALAALAKGPVRVRMGMHTGSPTVTAEGYVGVDVHRGARVAALAHGGQILVSPTTAALLEGEELRDLGAHRLKDFEGATRLFQLGDDDFPPLRTPGSVQLPLPPTRFVGREAELFDAVSLVYDADPRILTVVGPGGTGKTRFAIELARLLAEEAGGGTVFAALAPLREPDLVLTAIAEALGAAAADTASIAARVGERRTHVVVDNAEHLLPGAARALAELASVTPDLRMYVTSREALRIRGEHELDLPPLAHDEAVPFFVERARAVRSDVDESEAVRQLCERLDRLPLALELAAARTKLLSPDALLQRLDDRLDLRGARDADQRHTTLRETIGWSYDLLAEDEQRLFRRLSVFRAGCTLESAEAVCEATLYTLGSLLDKSLIRRRTGRAGEARFWMLETIKEFASERLDDSDEAQETRRRHAERMREIARAAHLSDDDHPSDVRAGLAELDDLRGALDWAEEADPAFGLELAVELQHLWNAAAPEEGMRRLSHLLEQVDPAPSRLRADALRVYGGAADLAGNYDLAEELQEASRVLYLELGDDHGTATVEHMLAVSAWRRGEWDRVRQLTEHSLELARGRFGFLETTGLWLLGQLALADGDVERATKLTLESAERAHEAGWSWWESGQLYELLRLALRRGDLDDAEPRGKAALRLAREQENRLWSLYAVAGLAQVALARGQTRRAGVLWGAVEAEGGRFPAWPQERAHRAGPLVDVTDDDFVAAVATGGDLDLWDAVAIALGEEELQL